MIYVQRPNDLPFKERLMPPVNRSRPFIILGTAVIAITALILSLGDPGKEERQQLMSSLAESQENIHLLEEKLAQLEVSLRQQDASFQQLLRKLEVSEDNSGKLKTRVDDLEKLVTRLRQQPAPTPAPVVVKKPVTPPAPVKSVAPAPKAVTPTAKPATPSAKP
jgi:hypothetical protein